MAARWNEDFGGNGRALANERRLSGRAVAARIAVKDQSSWPLAFGLFILVLALMVVQPAKATTPDETLKRLANELTDAVRADSELQNPYSERMAQFMRKRVVPRFNFEMITRDVIGKNWLKATSDERRTLVNQFSQLMIRSYAKAVAKLKDFDIEVQSVKVITPNESVVVRTRMIGLPQSYTVDYDMAAEDGGWRVRDITFEGVSLVNSYRDEFNSLIASSGIEGLITDLQRQNEN